jgi:hypothetical protein
MPSGLRVSRIDRVPTAGVFPLMVNGVEIGNLPHRTLLELTLASGEILLEVTGVSPRPLFQVLNAAPGCTARVRFGRRCSLGVFEPSHYLEVDPAVPGLPDRSQYPLNLSAHSTLDWLLQRRAQGQTLSPAQLLYLHSQQRFTPPASGHEGATVPSLAELGAFAALGLGPEASEADVREAFRMLISIHAPEGGQANETTLRLDEAFQVALAALKRRHLLGVSGVGR